MDESDPTPSNPLEKIFSKLTLAQRANNSIQRQTHEKLDAAQRRMEMLERKVDSCIEMVRHANSTTRIVVEKISIVQEHGRTSIEELREIRRVFNDNQRVLVVTGKDMDEARKELAELKRDLTPVHGVTVPTKEELEAEGFTGRGIVLKWNTLLSYGKHALPTILTSGGLLALYHAVRVWLAK